MKPAMYTFINKGLGMSTGKAIAQGEHAAVEAALLSNGFSEVTMTEERARLWDAWRQGLHYAKYVMECRDREHLLDTERYLTERGIRTKLIIDEGHTEVEPITPTALGVEIVDKDDPEVAAIFSSFKLYRDPPRNPTKLGPPRKRRGLLAWAGS